MRPTPPDRKVHHETILEETDSFGTNYYIKDRANGRPKIEVGFSGPTLLICQENPKSNDVLEVTVGQAYDLLTVLSKALNIPVKGF